LQRGQPAAYGSGGDLGDVHRRQHAGRADADTAQEARSDEEAGRARGARGERADKKDDGVQQHRWAPAVEAGDPPGRERSDRATDQHRGHGETRRRGASPERAGQGLDGPVDHGAVETEEKASESGDRAEPDDVAMAGHSRSPGTLDRLRAAWLSDLAGEF